MKAMNPMAKAVSGQGRGSLRRPKYGQASERTAMTAAPCSASWRNRALALRSVPDDSGVSSPFCGDWCVVNGISFNETSSKPTFYE